MLRCTHVEAAPVVYDDTCLRPAVPEPEFFFLLTSSGRVRTRDELSADLQAESLATHFTTATPQAPAFFFNGS